MDIEKNRDESDDGDGAADNVHRTTSTAEPTNERTNAKDGIRIAGLTVLWLLAKEGKGKWKLYCTSSQTIVLFTAINNK